MRKNRTQEAMDYMRSSRWLCGPSKIAVQKDVLAIESLPQKHSRDYQRIIRRSICSLIDDGKESALLLTGARTHEGGYKMASNHLSDLAEQVHRSILDYTGVEMEDKMERYMRNRWRDVHAFPEQRVELPIPGERPDEEPDSFLLTTVSSAYHETHPRYFPMDALAMTRMSTINATLEKIRERIYAAAGKRAGVEYSTQNFFVIPGSAASEQ